MTLAHHAPGFAPSAGIINFAGETKCRYLELLSYPGLPRSLRLEDALDDTSLAVWFDKDLSSSTQEGQTPSRGLRLLLGVCDVHPGDLCPNLSFRKDSFKLIEERLGLPSEFLKSITGSITQAFKFSKQSRGRKPLICFVFKLAFYRRTYFQLALSYDTETRLTYGLLLAKDHGQVNKFLKGLQDQAIDSQQPLLLALMAMEEVIDSCDERLSVSDQKLNDLEETMGQHEYDDRPKGNPLELNFLMTTRTLNHISKRVGVDVSRLESVLIALKKLQDWKNEIAADSQLSSDNEKKAIAADEAANGFRMAEEKTGYLSDTCRVLILRAQYTEKRTQTLIQVVYQFMAQKDAKVNIHLAESSAALAKSSKDDSAIMRVIAVESKKDSSAMKRIAILGMFFLPGTFVAAIFAMPVFNWSDDGNPVLKTGFRYYWAVAVPLTVLVFLSWAVASLLPWRAWMSRPQSISKQPGMEMELG